MKRAGKRHWGGLRRKASSASQKGSVNLPPLLGIIAGLMLLLMRLPDIWFGHPFQLKALHSSPPPVSHWPSVNFPSMCWPITGSAVTLFIFVGTLVFMAHFVQKRYAESKLGELAQQKFNITRDRASSFAHKEAALNWLIENRQESWLSTLLCHAQSALRPPEIHSAKKDEWVIRVVQSLKKTANFSLRAQLAEEYEKILRCDISPDLRLALVSTLVAWHYDEILSRLTRDYAGLEGNRVSDVPGDTTEEKALWASSHFLQAMDQSALKRLCGARPLASIHHGKKPAPILGLTPITLASQLDLLAILRKHYRPRLSIGIDAQLLEAANQLIAGRSLHAVLEGLSVQKKTIKPPKRVDLIVKALLARYQFRPLTFKDQKAVEQYLLAQARIYQGEGIQGEVLRIGKKWVVRMRRIAHSSGGAEGMPKPRAAILFVSKGAFDAQDSRIEAMRFSSKRQRALWVIPQEESDDEILMLHADVRVSPPIPVTLAPATVSTAA